MEETLKFLEECGTFYLATTEGDQPRVRPFGAVFIYEGKLYTASSNAKKCFDQILKNPKVEISGMNKGQWIRLEGKLTNDDRREVKEYALNAIPSLKNLYNIDDGIFSVLYFSDVKATIFSFKGVENSFEF
jgi:uncharacterized pyridoxamine 5'-phosphate oxidase family protein